MERADQIDFSVLVLPVFRAGKRIWLAWAGMGGDGYDRSWIEVLLVRP